MSIVIAGLRRGKFPLHRPTVDAHGGAGFHSVGTEPEAAQLFGEAVDGRFCRASAFNHGASNVHQAVQERTVCEHDGFRAELGTLNRAHTFHGAVFNDEFVGIALPDIEAGGIFKYLAPELGIFGSVALHSRTPHRGPFRAVEHAELDGSSVSHDTHHAPERIYFPDNLTFCYTAHGGIAAHLSNIVHIEGYEQCRHTETGSRGGCLTAGMAGAHNNYVVVKLHISYKTGI